MKKIFVFGTLSLFLLAIVLSGCQNVGEAKAKPVSQIKATSCDADSVCEANSLNTKYITTTAVKGDGDLTLTTDNGGLILNPDKKSVVVEGTLMADYFSVTTLAGDGIAYACIDDDGKIFRSLTPCR